MKNAISRIVVATAAASMAFAPIAAQANTRAGDSTALYSVQGAGVPFIDDDDDEESGWLRGILIAVLLLGAIGGVAIVVGDGDNQSPGAN